MCVFVEVCGRDGGQRRMLSFDCPTLCQCVMLWPSPTLVQKLHLCLLAQVWFNLSSLLKKRVKLIKANALCGLIHFHIICNF